MQAMIEGYRSFPGEHCGGARATYRNSIELRRELAKQVTLEHHLLAAAALIAGEKLRIRQCALLD